MSSQNEGAGRYDHLHGDEGGRDALVVAQAQHRAAQAHAHLRAHASAAYGSAVEPPRADWRRIEALRGAVAGATVAAGGYTAGDVLGF